MPPIFPSDAPPEMGAASLGLQDTEVSGSGLGILVHPGSYLNTQRGRRLENREMTRDGPSLLSTLVFPAPALGWSDVNASVCAVWGCLRITWTVI